MAQHRKSLKRLVASMTGLLEGVPMFCFILYMLKNEGAIALFMTSLTLFMTALQIALFMSSLTCGMKLAAGKETIIM